MFTQFNSTVFFSALSSLTNVAASNVSAQSFPQDFLFGVASAAYQIEGAWNIDGKGASIWDEFTHSYPEKIVDRQNGDTASNSYEYFLDDIEAVKHLNVCARFYRYFMNSRH